jgi:hypothetical protein
MDLHRLRTFATLQIPTIITISSFALIITAPKLRKCIDTSVQGPPLDIRIILLTSLTTFFSISITQLIFFTMLLTHYTDEITNNVFSLMFNNGYDLILWSSPHLIQLIHALLIVARPTFLLSSYPDEKILHWPLTIVVVFFCITAALGLQHFMFLTQAYWAT